MFSSAEVLDTMSQVLHGVLWIRHRQGKGTWLSVHLPWGGKGKRPGRDRLAARQRSRNSAGPMPLTQHNPRCYITTGGSGGTSTRRAKNFLSREAAQGHCPHHKVVVRGHVAVETPCRFAVGQSEGGCFPPALSGHYEDLSALCSSAQWKRRVEVFSLKSKDLAGAGDRRPPGERSALSAPQMSVSSLP